MTTRDGHTEYLEGDGVLKTVEALRARLSDAIEAGAVTALDLSGMGVTDISFVQLIVSASRTADRSGRPLSLTGLSPDLRLSFAKAGVGIDPASGRITDH